ncbi:L-aspartate oxidase [bacterium]|nr:L-aspartate oxidase [bacterium]
MTKFHSDLLVIGSGLSGLGAALHAAERGLTVALVTKNSVSVSCSIEAQGGIASVIDIQTDSFSKHISDTINAGVGLNKPEIVEYFVRRGPEAIKEMELRGIRFTKNSKGGFDLGKEGGHSERRVVHAGDITGQQIISVVAQEALKHPLISIYENHTAVDLITTNKFKIGSDNRVVGCYVLTPDESVELFAANTVLLATGGCGKVYLYTSNPRVTSGDGVAIGMRAGLSAINMEMIQFHPTILHHEKATSVLISEALRGEGGILKTVDGNPVMEGVHPLKDLAPRDIVARAIDAHLKQSGDDFIYLDMTHLGADFLYKRFPNITNICKSVGIDIANDPIPVVPAAHYMCGGLKATPEGVTDIPGLFVAGEIAHTGLHGANRLASNSLLEAAVMAREVVHHIDTYLHSHDFPEKCNIPLWNDEGITDSPENIVIKQNWEEIRHLMWNYVGIVRSNSRLKRAMKRIAVIKEEITEYYWNFKITNDLIELRNLTIVAETIIRSAQKRKESRGLHHNIDFPERQAKAEDTSVSIEELLP